MDYQAKTNRISLVEVISDVSGAPRIEASFRDDGLGDHGVSDRMTWRLPAIADRNKGRGFYLRIRGQSARGYWFYTSAIRILPSDPQ